MKYIGTIQSEPDSGTNDQLSHLINGDRIDRPLPGQSSLWLSGYVINHSFVDRLILNFYNSSRELQRTIIPPRHKVQVKNQNADRLQIDISETSVSATYSYKFLMVEAESVAESSYLLVYATQDISQLENKNDLVSKILQVDLTPTNQFIDLKINENRQLVVSDIWLDVLPASLPTTKPIYQAAIQVFVNEINDSSIIIKRHHNSYFFQDYWRSYDDKQIILDGTGTEINNAGLRIGINDNIGTVEVRLTVKYYLV